MTAALATRGTTNRNDRGSSYDRARRRAWLVQTYRADADSPTPELLALYPNMRETGIGCGEPACRCYRCGILLTVNTVTVDRIIPGAKGGTYRRNNIRPACDGCNEETGGKLGAQQRAAKQARRARRRAAA